MDWECEQVAMIRAAEFEVLVHRSLRRFLTSYILGPLCIFGSIYAVIYMNHLI
jgi:hypothetical protein